MNCSIPGCEKTVEKRGWCGMHYRRFQRHGDPLVNKRPEQIIGTPEERFWPKVAKQGPDDCWEWTGWRLPRGYGHFGKGGRAGGTMLTHRFAYELAHGPVPKGMEVSHTCDNPPCCNPAHLVAETHAENLHRAPNAQFKRNAAKTHCKHGHPFDEANTIRRPDRPNYRGCRACGLVAVKKYQQSKHGTVS